MNAHRDMWNSYSMQNFIVMFVPWIVGYLAFKISATVCKLHILIIVVNRKMSLQSFKTMYHLLWEITAFKVCICKETWGPSTLPEREQAASVLYYYGHQLEWMEERNKRDMSSWETIKKPSRTLGQKADGNFRWAQK